MALTSLMAVIWMARSAPGAPVQEKGVDVVAWMAGSWIEHKGPVETEESWLAPKGRLLLGVNRTVREGGKTSFEFLRIIERKDGVVYIAQPSGAPPTEFPAKSVERHKVVFENLKNDFPHRIIYSLKSDGDLLARIEGQINGNSRAMEWTFKRAKN